MIPLHRPPKSHDQMGQLASKVPRQLPKAPFPKTCRGIMGTYPLAFPSLDSPGLPLAYPRHYLSASAAQQRQSSACVPA